jgi:glycosyltransferase involved in cell wall biosynthesis
MKRPLVIISSECPPKRGGLADHTVKLAQGLAKDREVTVLTDEGAADGDGYQVAPVICDWRQPQGVLQAMAALAPQADILWQYVPHMYGRGGVNPRLPLAMEALNRRGRHQCLIAHEIASAFSPWPNRFLYALAHRYQWRLILRSVGSIGISTEASLREWSERQPRHKKKFFLAPSPSNIDVVPVSVGHAGRWRERNGLGTAASVMGYFGSLSRFKQFDWVVAAWIKAQGEGRKVGLVAVGDVPTAAVPEDLRSLFRPLGYLSAPAVSEVLQAIDLLVLPFADGAAEKRGSFMAGLNHGCPIVSTVGPTTGPTLRQAGFFVGVDSRDRESFVAQASRLAGDGSRRSELGPAGRRAYQQQYDWPRLLTSVCEQLARLGNHV